MSWSPISTLCRRHQNSHVEPSCGYALPLWRQGIFDFRCRGTFGGSSPSCFHVSAPSPLYAAVSRRFFFLSLTNHTDHPGLPPHFVSADPALKVPATSRAPERTLTNRSSLFRLLIFPPPLLDGVQTVHSAPSCFSASPLRMETARFPFPTFILVSATDRLSSTLPARIFLCFTYVPPIFC